MLLTLGLTVFLLKWVLCGCEEVEVCLRRKLTLLTLGLTVFLLKWVLCNTHDPCLSVFCPSL